MANNPSGSGTGQGGSNSSNDPFNMNAFYHTNIPGLTLAPPTQRPQQDERRPFPSEALDTFSGQQPTTPPNRSPSWSGSYHPSPPPAYVPHPDHLADDLDAINLNHNSPTASEAVFDDLYDDESGNVALRDAARGEEGDMDMDMDIDASIAYEYAPVPYADRFETVEIIEEWQDAYNQLWYRLRAQQRGANEAGYDCTQEWNSLSWYVEQDVVDRWCEYQRSRLLSGDVVMW